MKTIKALSPEVGGTRQQPGEGRTRLHSSMKTQLHQHGRSAAPCSLSSLLTAQRAQEQPGGQGVAGFGARTCLRPCGTAAAAHISPLASRLSCITSEECSPSTSLEAEQRDNLVLIQICCYEQEGHNDGLRFQSENVYGTTAGDQKPSVSQGNMLTLGGGEGPSTSLPVGVVIRIFHWLIEVVSSLHR